MRDPRHPGHFTDEFKGRIVDLYNAGKPKREAMDEYDLGKSAVERRIESINATGSPRAADNRTPGQNRILELERENRRLRMEVDVLFHALETRLACRVGPRRAGRGRGPRRQQGAVRLAQDKGVAREVGRDRQPVPGLPRHEGEQSIQRIRQEEVQGAPRGGRRGRRAERRRARPRRRGAAHPYMQRPGLRARRGLVELRLPARRPLQQGDRRPLRRAREGRPAGQAGVRDAPLPDLGHRVFQMDRGGEFDNAEIDLMLEALGIERPLAAKGCPYDNAGC